MRELYSTLESLLAGQATEFTVLSPRTRLIQANERETKAGNVKTGLKTKYWKKFSSVQRALDKQESVTMLCDSFLTSIATCTPFFTSFMSLISQDKMKSCRSLSQRLSDLPWSETAVVDECDQHTHLPSPPSQLLSLVV